MEKACPRYIPDPVHLLTEANMCVPDLYTFVKLYGTDAQVQEMATLRKLRRRLLLPIYREARRNPQRVRRFFGRSDLPPVPQPLNNGNNNGPPPDQGDQRMNNGPPPDQGFPFVFQANNNTVRRTQPVRVTQARRRAAKLVQRSAIRKRMMDFQRFTEGRRPRQPNGQENNRVRPDAERRPVRRRAPLVRPVRSANRGNFERFTRERRIRPPPDNITDRPERPRSAPVVRRRVPLVRPDARVVARSANRANFERFSQEVRRQTNRTRQETERPAMVRRSPRLAARR